MGTVYLLSIDSEVSVSHSRYMVCSEPASKHPAHAHVLAMPQFDNHQTAILPA